MNTAMQRFAVTDSHRVTRYVYAPDAAEAAQVCAETNGTEVVLVKPVRSARHTEIAVDLSAMRETELRDYARHRDIPLPAAIAELVNVGLSNTPDWPGRREVLTGLRLLHAKEHWHDQTSG